MRIGKGSLWRAADTGYAGIRAKWRAVTHRVRVAAVAVNPPASGWLNHRNVCKSRHQVLQPRSVHVSSILASVPQHGNTKPSDVPPTSDGSVATHLDTGGSEYQQYCRANVERSRMTHLQTKSLRVVDTKPTLFDRKSPLPLFSGKITLRRTPSFSYQGVCSSDQRCLAWPRIPPSLSEPNVV